jgi:hypothetical protein
MKKQMPATHPKRTGTTLIATLVLIAVIATVSYLDVMLQFMGVALLALAVLKLINIKGFAAAYANYDLIASKSKAYAYAYPFIELALGLMYFFAWNVRTAAIVTLVVFTLAGIGVGRTLAQKKTIYCACVGTLFKIPLTTFTLAEDIAMVAMSLMLLAGV